MSAKATNWVWESSESTGSDRLVLLALADFCNESAECYASYGKLIEKTRLGRMTVHRSLKRLQEIGELHMVAQGDVGTGSRQASTWRLPKIHKYQSDTCKASTSINLIPVKYQSDTTTIHNNTSTIGTAPTAPPQPPELTLVKESNSPPSGIEKPKPKRKREGPLGVGLSDDEWLTVLAAKYTHINIPALFDRCLGWCREKGKVASRRQFMAFVRNAKEDRPMQVSKPQPVGQSAWDRELAEIRRAAGE